MAQVWVPMLWHQDQSWLLIIDGLGGTAPRKAAPYDQTEGGRERWTRSWFLLQTPWGGGGALPENQRDSVDSAILWPRLLQASAQLCQSQRPSRGQR